MYFSFTNYYKERASSKGDVLLFANHNILYSFVTDKIRHWVYDENKKGEKL